MAWGKQRSSRGPTRPTALLSLLLGLALLAAAACGPPKAPPTPIPKVPSVVVTEDGFQFFVRGLKLPGTSQELKLKEGETTTWLPLAIMQVITFSGPVDGQYRHAEIVLNSGEKLRGDLFVGQLLEGKTDLGYWNMQMARIRQVGMGED